MKIVTETILNLFLLLSLSITGHSKQWRGIIPLRSTRADVERLLGRPADPYDEIFGPPQDSDDYYHKYSVRNYKYSLEQEDVYISFSSWGSASECATRLPIGTVLGISITPKIELHLSDLQLDESKLIRFDPSMPPNIGYEGYIDEEEGIIIRTFKSKIDQINYTASAADRQLCPDTYNNLKERISVLVDFKDRSKGEPNESWKEESGKKRNNRKP